MSVGIGSSQIDNSASISGATGLLYSNTAPSAALTNTTTETTLFSFVLPANTLRAGRTLKIRVRGVYAIDSANPNTLQFKLYSDTTVLETGNAKALAATAPNLGWFMDIDIVCYTEGVSGTVEVGSFQHMHAIASDSLADTSPITIDTTADHTIAFKAKWTSAFATSSVTVRQIFAEVAG